MTRLMAWALLTSPVWAQEHGGEVHGDPWIWWKWANFAILAVVMGYLIAKTLPAFFKNRTAEIQKGIADAQKLKQESETRAAAMDQRMSKLGDEVEKLRASAGQEMERESQRIRRDTEAHTARIRAQAEQDIQAAGAQARRELRIHAAQLAVDLAEQRVRQRLDPATESHLVGGFLRDMESRGAAR